MAKQIKSVNNLSDNSFLGLLFIVIGIFLIMGADTAVSLLFTILGAILIVIGTTELFHKNWIVGAVELALGIISIVFGQVLIPYLTLILGIICLAYAIYLIVVTAVKYGKASAAKICMSLITPLLLIVLGILLILQYCGIVSIFKVIGAIAIAIGAFIILYDLIKKVVYDAKHKN